MLHPRLDEQTAHLSALLATSPDSVQLLTLRGTVYFQHEDFDLALADFEHALSHAPKDAALIRHKAATFHQLGLSNAAITVLSEHLEIANTDADAFLLRGRVLRSLHRLTEAAQDFEQVLVICESARPEVFLELADVYRESADFNACATTLRKGVDRLGQLGHLLEPLARAQIAIADYSAAEATIEQFECTFPGSVLPALLTAERLDAMGDRSAAMRCWRCSQWADAWPSTRTEGDCGSCVDTAATGTCRRWNLGGKRWKTASASSAPRPLAYRPNTSDWPS